MVEWEVTLKCNYSCVYCTNLDPSIKPVLDKRRIRDFIQMLGKTYPGVEIFVFGGEPFIHPYIDYIIQMFNKYDVPFVIQTNLSKKSIHVMKKIKEPFIVQVSIHPTEITLDQVSIPDNINIRVIDVMYTGREAIKYYLKVKDMATSVFLTPIGDFGDGVSGPALRDFNRMRETSAWNKIINFERVKRLGEYRSNLWENGGDNFKGHPCIYNDKYFLYGPNLDLYNCCHRVKHDGICNHEKCFLM